jgi:ribonuclease HIII
MSKNENKAKSSCFVAIIDLSLADKIKSDLLQFGFELSNPTYTLFSGKKKGLSVTLYQSGKLMVQGKEMGEFIEFYIEPEILKSFTFSHPEQYADMNAHMGSDEAGKGDFFGPLCIATVYADKETISKLLKMGINDTKKMTDKKTLDLAKKLKTEVTYHVVKIGPEKYNDLYNKFKNLNSLLAWGHAAAIDHVYQSSRCNKVIIDKFASDTLISNAVKRKNKDLELILRTKAEEDVVVAAAATLARATFLWALDDLSNLAGIKLPKGASDKVKEVAISICKKDGPEALAKFCKKHFKTYEEVINKC